MFYALQILLLGAVAGWLAGKLMNYPTKDFLNTLIIGVAGSLLGSYIFDFVGFVPKKILGTFLMALIGSCVVLWLIRWIKMRM